MSKIQITLDVSKITKSKIVDRKFTNKSGEEVVIKEAKFEVVPLKEAKLIKQGLGWNLMKTHFIVEQQTKEERTNKVPNVFVGEGFEFVDTKKEEGGEDENFDKDINPEDIPF